jgi:hypothetical protein
MSISRAKATGVYLLLKVTTPLAVARGFYRFDEQTLAHV